MTHPRALYIGEMLFDRLSNEPGRSLAQVTSWRDYAPTVGKQLP
jgi:fructokinase